MHEREDQFAEEIDRLSLLGLDGLHEELSGADSNNDSERASKIAIAAGRRSLEWSDLAAKAGDIARSIALRTFEEKRSGNQGS